LRLSEQGWNIRLSLGNRTIIGEPDQTIREFSVVSLKKIVLYGAEELITE
jgi:hypothetical protein